MKSKAYKVKKPTYSKSVAKFNLFSAYRYLFYVILKTTYLDNFRVSLLKYCKLRILTTALKITFQFLLKTSFYSYHNADVMNI